MKHGGQGQFLECTSAHWQWAVHRFQMHMQQVSWCRCGSEVGVGWTVCHQLRIVGVVCRRGLKHACSEIQPALQGGVEHRDTRSKAMLGQVVPLCWLWQHR